MSRSDLAVLGIFAAFCALWMVPNTLAIIFHPISASIVKWILAALFLAAWFVAFPKLRTAVLLSLPVFLLLPADIFFFLTYREPLTTHILPTIFDTNPHEARDYLRGRELQIILFVLVCAGVWWQAARLARGRSIALSRMPAAYWPARALLAFVPLSFVMVAYPPPSEIKDACATATPRCRFIERIPLKLKGVFPIGRLFSLSEYLREEKIITYLHSAPSEALAGLSRSPVRYGQETYVLVIGETGRADRMGINGYARDTTPLLKKTPGVVPLRDMITPYTLTTYAVPAILSPVKDLESPRTATASASIVRVFKLAGFKTFWISNQPTFGATETSITRIGREADEWFFTNPSTNAGFGQGTYDDVLLQPFERLLARADQQRFFVIHIMGSHDSYQRRHPESFEKFRPSLRDLPSANPNHHDPKLKVEINNSYDNSILYTDYILSEIIKRLEAVGGVSALLYSADHGETLFDGECTYSGHGGSGREQYPVAALAWVSEKFRSARAEEAQALQANSVKRLTTRNLFPSFLQLGGISLPTADPLSSIFSPKMEQRTRWVKARSVVDWDAARVEGACNDIVP